MAKLEKEERVKVLLDSSVIIAATLSFAGASFKIIEQAKINYSLFIIEYSLNECYRVILEKYPLRLRVLEFILQKGMFTILKNPSDKEVKRVISIIEPKDSPILAAASVYKVDYLITLDKKHFLQEKVIKFAKANKFKIVTPKDFIQIIK